MRRREFIGLIGGAAARSLRATARAVFRHGLMSDSRPFSALKRKWRGVHRDHDRM